jgi:hypothetical protein
METKMQYSADQFVRDLAEPYAWPGGYPRYFITADGAALSYAAAENERRLIRRAIRTDDNTGGWRVIGCDINWEDADLYCDHTGARIESAYAETTE